MKQLTRTKIDQYVSAFDSLMQLQTQYTPLFYYYNVTFFVTSGTVNLWTDFVNRAVITVQDGVTKLLRCVAEIKMKAENENGHIPTLEY